MGQAPNNVIIFIRNIVSIINKYDFSFQTTSASVLIIWCAGRLKKADSKNMFLNH